MSIPQTSNDPIRFEGLYPATSREKEAGKVFEWIKQGSSCQLLGIPGVGRSNVLALLAHNRAARTKYLGEKHMQYHFVYMDFSEVKNRSLADVMKFMLISLSFSLSDRELMEEQKAVNEFLKEALEFQDDIVLFQALKRSVDFLCVERKLTVVFLFDRFDQYTANVTEQFFLNLKVLRNRAKYRFSCVFSLARPLEEILETSIYFEFYEFFSGNTVFLPLYDAPGTEFRFAYLEQVADKKSGNKTKKEIIALTGGHGKLARLSYEAVLSEENTTKNLKEFLLSKKHVIGTLWSIWNALLPEEHETLKALASAKKKGNKTPQMPDYLTNSGLVENGKIAIPLLEEFVKTLPEAARDTKIRYDETTNDIIQGEESLTDKLSPAEFRLLRFLIQNEAKVCEKDEIISAVWKDSKTQEGVTDQALDQIIYRLRKKVEDDPNKPIHIQTVKGRGYRFSA